MLAKMLFGLIFTALTSCEPINRYLNEPDDWYGEEITEGIIKFETGIDVDLTPSTPEK